MAQLLSPVCTEALFCQNLSSKRNIGKWNRSSSFVNYSVNYRRLGNRFKVSATTTNSGFGDEFADDYYAVLGLVPDATPEQIKKAYYNCMKSCHPDLSGNDPETTNFCMFINDVYEVLSDPVQRRVYDEIHGYALTAINPFVDDSCTKDHVFVDEFSCIGCKNCANVAPSVFDIEEDFGRARAYSQCGKQEVVQQAIDSCPVDCIHWTSAPQLSLLEDEMRRVERVNVALMLSGMGSMGVDVFRASLDFVNAVFGARVFSQKETENITIHLNTYIFPVTVPQTYQMLGRASSRWQKRQSKILEQARMRMVKQEDSGKTDSYWSNAWGNPKDNQNTEEEVKERSRRAAAAARKWREYSRRGADKPPKYKLPEAVSNKDI